MFLSLVYINVEHAQNKISIYSIWVYGTWQKISSCYLFLQESLYLLISISYILFITFLNSWVYQAPQVSYICNIAQPNKILRFYMHLNMIHCYNKYAAILRLRKPITPVAIHKKNFLSLTGNIILNKVKNRINYCLLLVGNSMSKRSYFLTPIYEIKNKSTRKQSSWYQSSFHH